MHACVPGAQMLGAPTPSARRREGDRERWRLAHARVVFVWGICCGKHAALFTFSQTHMIKVFKFSML